MKHKPDKHSVQPNEFDKKEVREIPLECIIPNRFQPRKTMDKESLQELIDSIKTHGVLEPIIVRPDPKKPDAYEIIMGERRFRACQALSKQTIPAVIKEADDRQMLEWAIIENTHRKDLNPIERAKGYKQLADTFNLTHQQVAERVGVGRTIVTHFIRLLSLSPEIQEDVRCGALSVGHAVSLLALPNDDLRRKIWQRVKYEDLSVRHLRILVDSYLHPRGISTNPAARFPPHKEFNRENEPRLKEWAERLSQKFGPNARVNLYYIKFGAEFTHGLVSIACNTEADFQHILKLLDPPPSPGGVRREA